MSLQMCRVCMMEGNNFNKLGTGRDSHGSKLNSCVPEIDLTILVNPVICQACLLMLESAYKLRKKCLLTERALKARLSTTNRGSEVPKNGIRLNHSINLKGDKDVVVDLSDVSNEPDLLHAENDCKVVGNREVRRLRPIKREISYNEIESDCEVNSYEDFNVASSEADASAKQSPFNNTASVINNIKEERIDITNHRITGEVQVKLEPCDDIEGGASDHTDNQHRKTSNKNGPKVNITKCLKCSRLFKNRGNLKTHMRVHNKFKCSYCLRWFDCKLKLDDHMSNRHPKDSTILSTDGNENADNECKVCSKLFPDKDLQLLHEKAHVACDMCDEICETKEALVIHTNLHMEIEESNLFKCNTCLQFFTQENYLLNHRCMITESNFITEIKPNMLTHLDSEELSFTCDVCGKVFPTKNRYNIHKRTHSEVLHFCTICNKPYKTQDSLIFHERSHTRPREKLHVCDICNISFESKGLLKNHKYIIHAEEEFFKCSVCSKEFAVKQRLEIHMRVHTGEKPYQCDLCGKCFQIKGSLIVHKKIHTNEKPFQCYNCGKRFITKGNLLMHSRVHTGERPYSCTICQRRFTVKNTLIVHIRNKHKHESFDMEFLCDYSDSFHDRLYEKLEVEYAQQCEDESGGNLAGVDQKPLQDVTCSNQMADINISPEVTQLVGGTSCRDISRLLDKKTISEEMIVDEGNPDYTRSIDGDSSQTERKVTTLTVTVDSREAPMIIDNEIDQEAELHQGTMTSQEKLYKDVEKIIEN